MAKSGVCEHCSTSMRPGEKVSRDGYSYHKKCHKCYVCSETDLKDADIFRGVIFCGGCYKRIFKRDATARVAKPARARRSRRMRERVEDSVLERVRAAAGSAASLATPDPEKSKPSAAGRTPVTHDCYCMPDVITRTRKLMSFIYQTVHSSFGALSTYIYTGNGLSTSTDVRDMNDPAKIAQQMMEALSPPGSKPSQEPPQPKRTRTSSTVKTSVSEKSETSSSRASRRIRVSSVKTDEKVPCSDLRIAELGVSTEIANMALRTTSTKRVKSETKEAPQKEDMATYSMFSNATVTSHTSNEEYVDSECEQYRGTKDSDRGILHHTIASIIRIPYNFFKRKILNRSSLISVIAGLDSESEKGSFSKRVKMLFHEDILDHRRNGYKKLYPTINKRNVNKLGWPDQTGDRNISPCKHFQECHSYRCMREQVMRMAGPTKSKIDIYRATLKKLLVPWFLQNLSIEIKDPARLKTKACGRSASAFVPRVKTGPGTAHYHPVARYVPTI